MTDVLAFIEAPRGQLARRRVEHARRLVKPIPAYKQRRLARSMRQRVQAEILATQQQLDQVRALAYAMTGAEVH